MYVSWGFTQKSHGIMFHRIESQKAIITTTGSTHISSEIPLSYYLHMINLF
jgi:hypothetical protein